jgi:DNA-binding XRE family transcriptional regulator
MNHKAAHSWFAYYELWVRFCQFDSAQQSQEMAQSKQQSSLLKSFGANLRRLRFQAGLTQAKLAELADVELRTEQKWESGAINPPLTTIARLQTVLGCRWEDLIGKPASKRQ